MTRKKVIVFVLLLIMLTSSFLILTYAMLKAESPSELKNISVIVQGKTGDDWESIKQGMEQASDEMHVELTFISVSAEDSLAEQISLLEREKGSGVDAIILSVMESGKLAAAMNNIAAKFPIVCLEYGMDNSHVTSYVSTDNYAMGVEVGRKILLSDNPNQNVLLVEGSKDCNNIKERRNGLLSVLDANGIHTIDWEDLNNSESSTYRFLNLCKEKKLGTVVAFSSLDLEDMAQMLSDEKIKNINLFGIGASSKIAHYIEQDVVNATVVQNDFGIGYLSIQAAVDALERRTVSKQITVEYRVIDQRNMYDMDNQRLLFPFVR
ncbi:substrate-binding domain-containing protein [Hydrogenoanaerobacterium sp.]|uniref:sugar ABC transporter substrate-binding protein n=1 Tax=Hydrogenoanaerobacterium sp. TaxID=2953763 RepID=UPI002898B35A|nr:substrate-binding domain-containing protein [Hydrogenoanaerobacterium sp.]